MTDSKITYRGVVYPWQCDGMGHFTTRHYMAMFDQAGWHFLHEVGFDPGLVTEKNIGWADVRHEIDYLKELREGELVVIESRPLRVGNKSIQYQLEMKSATNGATCARLTATWVQFDLVQRCAIPVLPEVREQILAWLDHPEGQ
jgi:acyl-CoA thioester hydrolase